MHELIRMFLKPQIYRGNILKPCIDLQKSSYQEMSKDMHHS